MIHLLKYFYNREEQTNQGNDSNEGDGELFFNQIYEYYKFHKMIESYFLKGINIDPEKTKEYLYFVDSYWIKEWKIYTNFDEKIKYIEENNTEKIDEIKNDKQIVILPFYCNSGESSTIFLSKILLKAEDFECIINKKTLDLFSNNSWFNTKNLDYIEGKFYDKMFLLLIEKQKRIKVFYSGKNEDDLTLIQLIIDFGIDSGNSFFNFNYEYVLDKCHKLVNLFEEESVGYITRVKLNKNTFKCYIFNVNLYNKNLPSEKDIDNFKLCLDNIDSIRTIGLENTDFNCYMNSILQCLVNIDLFTRYLLKQENFSIILKNRINCEILYCYSSLLQKLCCDEDIIKYYSPKDLKEAIIRKNPIFQNNKINYKDLLYFLLSQMKNELNAIEIQIDNNTININDKKSIYNKTINSDRRSTLFEEFITKCLYKNNNIIGNLFYTFIEKVKVCGKCDNHINEFYGDYSFEFPLETIYKSINKNQDEDNKKLSLYDCFSYFIEPKSFEGEESIYCGICKKEIKYTCTNKILSLSQVLIIILNRGEDNIFKCNFDFPENLDLQKYIKSEKSNYNFTLKGVVTHLGNDVKDNHFVAFCRHRISKEWYFYNDTDVTLCTDQVNEYKKGIPYILIYESNQGKKNIIFDRDNENTCISNTTTNSKEDINNLENTNNEDIIMSNINIQNNNNLYDTNNNYNVNNNNNQINNNNGNMNYINNTNNGFNIMNQNSNNPNNNMYMANMGNMNYIDNNMNNYLTPMGNNMNNMNIMNDMNSPINFNPMIMNNMNNNQVNNMFINNNYNNFK